MSHEFIFQIWRNHEKWDSCNLFSEIFLVLPRFFTTKTLFLSVIYSITDTNDNSPWRNETNKWITIQITMLLFLWTKSSWWNVVPWTLTSPTKPGFTAVDTFVSHYQDESGLYCVFFISVLMCTAYTNLANTRDAPIRIFAADTKYRFLVMVIGRYRCRFWCFKLYITYVIIMLYK